MMEASFPFLLPSTVYTSANLSIRFRPTAAIRCSTDPVMIGDDPTGVHATATSYATENATTTTADIDTPTYTTKVVLSAIIGLFLLISAIGSTLTMAVIARNKSLHTKANYFIFSLCVSDLISALCCSPLWLYRRTWGFEEWLWGNGLCKFYWVSDYATNYVTALHIVSFAALRFAAVKRPFFVAKITKHHTLVYVVVLWVIATATSVPLAVFMGVDLNKGDRQHGSYWPSCSLVTNPTCCVHQYDIYIYIVNSALFYLPMVLITILSIAIARTLVKKRRYRERHLSSINYRNSQVRNNNDDAPNSVTVTSFSSYHEPNDARGNHSNGHVNKAFTLPGQGRTTAANLKSHGPVTHTSSRDSAGHGRVTRTASKEAQHNHDLSTFTQLTLIVISFMIGYIPVTVYLLWSTATPEARKSPEDDYWFGVISYVLLRLSECMNPVMYNLGSKTLRNASKKLVRSALSPCFLND